MDSQHVDVRRIFKAAAAQGRKLQWLANATGVSLSYLTKMKNGNRPALTEWAQRAAFVLGLPPDDFLPFSSSDLDISSSHVDNRLVATERERVA